MGITSTAFKLTKIIEEHRGDVLLVSMDKSFVRFVYDEIVSVYGRPQLSTKPNMFKFFRTPTLGTSIIIQFLETDSSDIVYDVIPNGDDSYLIGI